MRVATWTVAVLVAVAVPGILVVNGFRVLATDTFVDRELGRDGFPPDLYGFDTEQRTALAKLGLRSIEPGSEGIVLLERATLPNGSSTRLDATIRLGGQGVGGRPFVVLRWRDGEDQ